MSTPGDHLAEEPQEERGAQGSRDTGSDQPAGGPADRPSGSYEGDESVPDHSDEGEAEFATGTTNRPPGDSEPAVPPYEGRQTEAKSGDDSPDTGARTGGATAPTTDADYKSPPLDETAGGATASPSQEQPASQASETDLDDDAVGPAHTSGTGRAEDER